MSDCAFIPYHAGPEVESGEAGDEERKNPNFPAFNRKKLKQKGQQYKMESQALACLLAA